MHALISVSDKSGVVELAKSLQERGVELLSTGGTARLLAESGLAVTEIARHTGFPEMLDGRVKTLHPTVHGGLLARRDEPAHMAALAEHGIATIDLLVVNLYPFEATVAQPGCSFDEAIENIDIGGPAMVRSAAKNWRHVAVLTDPAQYAGVIDELAGHGALGEATRYRLAVAAFARIAAYDAAISNWLSAPVGRRSAAASAFPAELTQQFVKLQDLRYGENPHQQAAFYRDAAPAAGALVTARQLQGKELSYNNIADADAAWECAKSVAAGERTGTVAYVIVKHANPCGVACASSALAAYEKAFGTDPTSAFGGIIAFSGEVDAACATAIGRQFVEVLVAPSYSGEALAILKARANVRVLAIDWMRSAPDAGVPALDMKRVASGLLVQSSDLADLAPAGLKTVTVRKPTLAQEADLLFAWRVAKYVKSNAIVFAADGATLAVGAGQMSRLDSARIAAIKAQAAGLTLAGSAAASDAFFPFRDGLDVIVEAGAACVIQPGGSVRDDEVIAAADERGVAMVFTGMRHFRH